MNCEDFNDRLPEYLDETLSAAEQAAAREHVQDCAACRQALARHTAYAKSIRRAFDRETQRLSLSAEVRQNILSEQALNQNNSIHPRMSTDEYGLNTAECRAKLLLPLLRGRWERFASIFSN